MFTAATLTAEIFKTITGLPPDSYQHLPILDFCPITLGTDSGTTVPALPRIEDTALIGAGAIGTAIALILGLLRTADTLTVVDPEHFDAPNLTTYSLGTRQDADARPRKVDLIEHNLPRLDLVKIHGTAQDLIDQIDQGTAPGPAECSAPSTASKPATTSNASTPTSPSTAAREANCIVA